MTLSLADLAGRMRAIDTCLVGTVSAAGLTTRPMSNNNDVDWNGTSWFFALQGTGLVRQIADDPRVVVTYTGEFGLWIAVTGDAVVHDDRELMIQHWDAHLERWFAEGVDTPGLRLVEVTARRVRYWTFADGDGEIRV